MNELFMINEAKIIYDATLKFNCSGCEAITAAKEQVNRNFNFSYTVKPR